MPNEITNHQISVASQFLRESRWCNS